MYPPLWTSLFVTMHDDIENQPIFPHNMIENYPTSLAHNSVLNSPNDFNFGTETSYVVLQAVL